MARTTAFRPPATSVVYRFGVVGNHGAISQLQLDRPTPIAGISGRLCRSLPPTQTGMRSTSDGVVWAWGVANLGELGNGTRPAYSTRAVKVDFPTGVRIARLANPMPFDGALAIDSQGHAWGWGLNADGDLCLSGLTEVRPVKLALSGVTSPPEPGPTRLSIQGARSMPAVPVSTASSVRALPQIAPSRSRSLGFPSRCQ